MVFESRWLNWVKVGLKLVFVGLIYFYRACLGVHFGGNCRFHPSCSQYALDALETHPLSSAVRLILSRFWRCRPMGASGFDPCPERIS